MKKILLLAGMLFVCTGIAFGEIGFKKRRPLPFEFGKIDISNYSKNAYLPSVQFDHWVHREKFTCRVCHVDIGFGMKANATNIKAIDNMNGYYCGSCHNGERAFIACTTGSVVNDILTCYRCHSSGKNIRKKYNFKEFVKRMPRERLGNGVDWEKAEAEGKINPIDFIDGISIQRHKLVVQKDFELHAKVEGMPNIQYSHKKHTVWNGCELCHPEIFIGIKKGMTKYSMKELYEGKYCGSCHNSVAFPLLDCQRCHVEKV
jgi:c(7)-type cytochrome triheme protein